MRAEEQPLWLSRLLPARGGAGEGAAGARERYLAFETVRGLLEQTAERWPLLLVLDDVHWADEDSLALLRHLARSALRARMLIVLCVRDTELGDAAAGVLGDLRREGPLVHVALGGLDDEAIAAVIARTARRADIDTARRYRERTGGNPLFLDELLRDERERTTAATTPPAGVLDVIARRLARLDEATRDTLELAALIGLEFDVGTLAAAGAGAGGRGAAELLDALGRAQRAKLIAPAGPLGRFAFAHALVAEAIGAQQPASRRAERHLKLADVLAGRHETDGDVGASEVARHLRAAGPLTDGTHLASWELAAAREATAALAHAEAAAHLEAALAARPAGTDRAALLVELGDARDRAGLRAAAREAFKEAAKLARARHDPQRLARAALGHGGLAVVIAAPERQTTALLEEALAAVPRRERATTARLRSRLAVELYYLEPHRARELSERALADARASRDQAALAAALNARRVALWNPACVHERLAVDEEMLAAAESAGDREAILQARNWRVVDLWELGRTHEVSVEIDAYEDLAESVGLPHFRWYVPLWRAGLAILAGRWSQAGSLGERALVLGHQADDPNAPLLVHVQREYTLDVQRRFTDIDRDWIARSAADSPQPAPWLAWLAMIDAAREHHDSARAIIAQLTRGDCAALPMNANWLAAVELAEAAADVGDRAAATTLHAKLAPHADQYAVVARGVGSENITEHTLGRLAVSLGRLDEAEARLRRAAALNDRAGAHVHAAVTLARLGDVLASRDDHDAARNTLGDALTRAEALRTPALAAESRAALRRLAQ